MGKRKTPPPPPPPPPPQGSSSAHSDSVPCSSGRRDLTPGENVFDSDELDIFKPHSCVKESMESHGKHSNSQISLGQHHYNLSRSMFLKRSRHHYGNQYSRRNSPNYHKPSPPFGKTGPLNDDRLCIKLGGKYNSELPHHPDFNELRERVFERPDRIRTSSSLTDSVSGDGLKMVCGLCYKSLRRKSHHFGSNIGSEELSVVGVLVCGHIYHADCLEQKMCLEDKRDPPCPTCLDFSLDPGPA